MPQSNADPIVFFVPGVDTAKARPSRGGVAGPGDVGGAHVEKHAIQLSTNRDGGIATATAVPGEDVVVLEIAGGPELRLHPDTARDLLQAQRSAGASDRGSRGPARDANAVDVPMQLDWKGLERASAGRGTSRGFGGVLLKAFKVITGIGGDAIAEVAVEKIIEKADGQVVEGVYRLGRESLVPLKTSGIPRETTLTPSDGPILVFVHGTFSSVSGTFSKLWTDHQDLVARLFDFYKERVYGLDHRTLSVSPIENALTLAESLPKGATVHLVTHSRGGLVAEVFAHACALPDSADRFGGDGPFAGQQDALRKLATIVRDKGITVERMVRVACPVRGTLLASKRLDAYISVLKWALELAEIPVAPELVELLGEVVKRKSDPSEMPGLEAQMPGSRLITWLHAVDRPIGGELRVIAGDIQGDSVVSWLKVLLSDSFFWTDNDLVVQTRSMYGGAPRANGALFVFDQNGAVSHFNYFKNRGTAKAAVDGLVGKDSDLAEYQTIGPLSWAGKSSDGLRAANQAQTSNSELRNKPLVFLLPGMFGSNLKKGNDRIWLGWRLVNGLDPLRYQANGADDVSPDGLIDFTYDKLRAFLAETHTVVDFPFDWRRPIEESARRLGADVLSALAARKDTNLPVRIVAHSSGGLVVRAMQLETPDAWNEMMARDGARVLMLGTPNAGSWTPMQILSGDDTLGNMLPATGAPFAGADARQRMAEFPGLLQLQACLSGHTPPLDDAATWRTLADDDLASLKPLTTWHNLDAQLDSARWGVPTQEVLDQAIDLRKRLNQQLDTAASTFEKNVVMVIGEATATPDGYEASPAEPLMYLDLLGDGDGRVTRESATLPGVRTWKVGCDHGSLPTRREAFDGYLDLLRSGDTTRLTCVSASASVRDATVSVAHQRSRPSRSPDSTRPPKELVDLLRGTQSRTTTEAPPRGAALRISVINGDLTFIGDPLIIGHYRSLRLTGTEQVMDDLIGGTMHQSLRVGRYPVEPGHSQVFDNVRARPFRSLPRPKAVIVVGLGDEGMLRPERLIETVQKGVLAWSQRVVETGDVILPLYDLAFTLMGSGGVGMSAGESAQCIAQGVKEANEILEQQDGASRWPRVGHLKLIELYLDRATEAWQMLRDKAAAAPALFSLDREIVEGHGSLKRPPDSGYRGADYDFISATTARRAGTDACIAYSVDTKRARTELRDESVQLPLISSMLGAATATANRDAQLGRALFKLLVPAAVKPFFAGTSPVVLELDSGTAGIPWELIETPGGGASDLPWGLRARVVRKLRLSSPAPVTQDANADADVLVIGEPQSDPTKYPPLPGAREEAVAVSRVLSRALKGAGSGTVDPSLIRPENRSLPGPDATTVVKKMLERDWRIIHIAGHGEPPEWVTEGMRATTRVKRTANPRGVVLSNDTYLGGREFERMTVVPELVFVNCCHLAATAPDELLAKRRASFAVSVAESLIGIGVRCVVAAAWAVDDDAAKAFATTFYDSLISGARFVDAVAAARGAAFQCGGNTWAAYQCYGDPEWTFRTATGDAQRPTARHDTFEGIASPTALRFVLNSIAAEASKAASRHSSSDGPERALADKLISLEGQFAKWTGRGEVAEAFATAWNELGDRRRAVVFFERAVAAADASATIKAAEQYCNVRARLAWDDVRLAAESGRAAAIVKSLKEAADAIDLLEKMAANSSTQERQSLRGSAHKRLAMIHAAARNDAESDAAVARSLECYVKAMAAGRAAGSADLYYPGLNVLAAAIVRSRAARVPFDQTVLDDVTETLQRKSEQDPDFWSVAGELELKVYRALGDCALARLYDEIAKEYENLHDRATSLRKWDSIFDTAYFVLDSYGRATADEGERTAAKDLLALLQGFVEG